MQYTRINLLFLDDLRFLEILESHNKLLNSFIDLMWLSCKYVLEILISSLVNFLGALSR
jgi:hypothetical protein